MTWKNEMKQDRKKKKNDHYKRRRKEKREGTRNDEKTKNNVRNMIMIQIKNTKKKTKP